MLLVFDKQTGAAVGLQSSGEAYDAAERQSVKLTAEQAEALATVRQQLRQAGRSDMDVEIVNGLVQAKTDTRPYFRVEVSSPVVQWGADVTVTFTRLDGGKAGQDVVEAFGELWLAPGAHDWTPDGTGKYYAHSTADVRLENPVEITVARG